MLDTHKNLRNTIRQSSTLLVQGTESVHIEKQQYQWWNYYMTLINTESQTCDVHIIALNKMINKDSTKLHWSNFCWFSLFVVLSLLPFSGIVWAIFFSKRKECWYFVNKGWNWNEQSQKYIFSVWSSLKHIYVHVLWLGVGMELVFPPEIYIQNHVSLAR